MRFLNLFLSLAIAGPVLGQQPALTVEAIFGTTAFAGDLVDVTWSPDGDRFTYVRAQSRGTDLVRVDARTGREDVLIRGFDLVPSGQSAPIRIEGYEFSEDRSRVLIYTNSQRVWRQNTKGEFYVWCFSEGS